MKLLALSTLGGILLAGLTACGDDTTGAGGGGQGGGDTSSSSSGGGQGGGATTGQGGGGGGGAGTPVEASCQAICEKLTALEVELACGYDVPVDECANGCEANFAAAAACEAENLALNACLVETDATGWQCSGASLSWNQDQCEDETNAVIACANG